jgi:hypothetical protein
MSILVRHRASLGLALLICTQLVVCSTRSIAQSPAAGGATETSTDSDALTKARDEFAKELALAGVKCPIGLPKVLLKDVKSWGHYDSDTNTLTTPLWSQLSDEQKGLFTRLAGPSATEGAARAEFETGIHHWVFVHELGHWTQTCTDSNKGKSHYEVEFGANRIAMAYWREQDPEIVEHMVGRFRGVLTRPSPVAAGQTPENYFNENYEKLAGTPAYTWFQAQMVVAAYEEAPKPTFRQAVGATRN